MTNGSLMKVKNIAEFYNTFDLHSAIIGLENQFLVFILGTLNPYHANPEHILFVLMLYIHVNNFSVMSGQLPVVELLLNQF